MQRKPGIIQTEKENILLQKNIFAQSHQKAALYQERRRNQVLVVQSFVFFSYF
jgi:hypothetical protein